MMDNRKRQRIIRPLVIEFRPTYGAREFTPAVVKNISCRGLTIESYFSFIQYENVDIKLYIPHGSGAFSLNGDIVWKKQMGPLCQAGVQLKNPDPRIMKTLRADFVSSLCRRGDAPGAVSP